VILPDKREESKPTHSDSEPETSVNPHPSFTRWEGIGRNWLACDSRGLSCSDTTITKQGTDLDGLDGLVGGEAEADVVGGPLAFGVAEFGAQSRLDFGDIGGSLGGEQG
jgi:hypothetical protein